MSSFPVWRRPHQFTLLRTDAPVPPIDVVTYGPIAADLIALADPTVETITKLGRGLGFEWLASLVLLPDRLPELPQPSLARYLDDRYALRPGVSANPFGVREGKLRRRRTEPLPTELVAEFAATEKGRLQQIGDAMLDLCGPLMHVAEGGEWKLGAYEERAVKRFNALGIPLRLSSVVAPGESRRTHVLIAPNLYARALLEVVQLYDDRPQLALCPACQRLFVPAREKQVRCRRFTWHAITGEVIATCTSAITRAELAHAATIRRREYKRFQMRVIRLRNRLGADHPDVHAAEQAFLEWQRENPAQVGRPAATPRPLELVVD
jgi:hypothetical protein